MKKIKITEQQMPVVQGNFDEVGKALDAELENYNGLVITADTLEGAKKSQRELATMRKDIDGLRLDVKRELMKPIADFDEKMNQLKNKVVACETPIKKGITVFDEEDRKQRKAGVDLMIAAALDKSGLDDNYKNRFMFNERWLNKTATGKSIQEDIYAEIHELQALQEMFTQTKSAIEQQVNQMNEAYKLASPMKPEPFIKQVVELGWTLTQVIINIGEGAKNQAEAEARAVESAQKEKTTIVPEPKGNEEQGPAVRSVTLTITATDEKIKLLQGFLKDNAIAYEKVSD